MYNTLLNTLKTLILTLITWTIVSSPALSTGDSTRGEMVFRRCISCHQVGDNARHLTGPVLTDIFGHSAGTVKNFRNYSRSLVAAGDQGLVWSEETLVQYLRNPRQFLRQYTNDPRAVSRMTFRLPRQKDREDVVAYLGTFASEAQAHDIIDPADALPRVKQTLVAPPFAPDHDQVARGGPKVVEITLIAEEKPMVIDPDGTQVIALTFNGTVPGPLVVVHEGDYVEMTLINPETNLMEHNIDFHASTGALGGGSLTHVSPGEKVVLRFKATKPGVFVYHCAPSGIQIPYHVTHGMSGAIMVLPRDGLKDNKGLPIRYDRAYYIGEQDYYIPRDENENYKSYEFAGENLNDWLEVARTLTPTHIVFNGAVGALTGDNALKAKVGETVLVIHAQANRDSRPHLIGGHGDYVWETGSFNDTPATNLETWFIRGGSAGAMIYTFHQPGIYAYLNHNLIEAVVLGALAHFSVEGEWNNDLMKQLLAPSEETEERGY